MFETARCVKTKTNKWTCQFAYESCYRKVTSTNWEYVKREAILKLDRYRETQNACVLVQYPCKVILQQKHKGRPIQMTLQECLIDNEKAIFEIDE